MLLAFYVSTCWYAYVMLMSLYQLLRLFTDEPIESPGHSVTVLPCGGWGNDYVSLVLFMSLSVATPQFVWWV
jgi:hypothetical protein